MIAIADVTYTYTGAATPLRFPDFRIEKGEHWLLLGESGSGKTTLLHLLGGLLRTVNGKIEVEGTDITKLSESMLDRFRGRHMGFVFQKNHLISALSVKSNLLLSPYLAGLPQSEARVNEVLGQLDLTDSKNSRISSLSHGQAQRVAIARAVLNKPDVILADEPTSALDDKNCERVIDLLLEASGHDHATLVVATHDQRLKSKFKRQIQL